MSKEFYKQVARIQQNLNAPKNQYNSFGKYPYRNLEDILEGVKPLLGDLVLTITDDVVSVGDRIYVKAVAELTDGENRIFNTGFARESLSKKGMDDSQVTGSTSSYARKYAVSGLLLCDDNKDADSHDNSNQASKPADHSDIIHKYTAADKPMKDAIWANLSDDQCNAISKSFEGK
jgi:hypothetical protein